MLAGQTGRYLIVGSLTVALYLGIFSTFLAVGLHYMGAVAIAQAIIIPIAFIAYRRWVFGRGTSVAADFLRFLGVWSGGMIAGFILTPLLVESTPVHPLAAQVLAIGVVTAANFVVHKWWTFRPRPERNTESS